jgi:tRNA(Ile2) C34 agmatinyltransferase TiaS
MDKKLQKIIESALKSPNPKCPSCKVEGEIKGAGEIAWCECPRCHKRIGDLTVM